MEEDLYLLLGFTTSGPEVPQAAIRKAYRAKALLCHPDKRGDDPVAAVEFVSLQKAYDVLGDEQARAAYDELLRVRKERLQKENNLSAKRRKMMQDLQDRERAHKMEQKAKVAEEQAAARLKVEIARIRKQRTQQQQEKVLPFSDKRNLSVPFPGTARVDAPDIDKTIKVTWACLEGGSGGYSAERLKEIFQEFGEVEDIVIRQGKSRRKSSALLVLGSEEAVIAATQRPCGDMSNPLLVVPAAVTSAAGSVSSEQSHPVATSPATARVSNGLLGASYCSFEDVTLLKMRQEGITPVHDLNPKCTSMNPDLVAIFFHGIGLGKNNEWKETWTSKTADGKSVCWPQEWLPEDLASKIFHNVRILSLSYDSALLGANEDVTEIGKNLIQSLVSKSEYEPLWEAQIVLVGYSFGGLVLKSLVVEVDKRAKQTRVEDAMGKEAKRSCRKFLENLKGTIFYGVPHAGGAEEFKEYFIWQCKVINDANRKQITKSGLLKNMEKFNRQMADLSDDFNSAVEPSLHVYAFDEGKPVPKVGKVLVPYASAQQLARRNHYKLEDAHHLTICKPTSKEAMNYSRLRDVLFTIMKGVQARTPPPVDHDTYIRSQSRSVRDFPSNELSTSNTTPELEGLC